MKTSIRKLDSVTHNDTAATKLINDNFEALQQGVEDAISRSGKTPNFMNAELDMNTRRIINCGDPVDDNDVVTVKWFKDTIVNIDALENKVDQEIIDRTNADTALSNAISTETNRAQSAENNLSNAISTETNRAQSVEGNLSNLTTTDKTSLVDAINELDGDVSSIEGTIEGYGDIVTHNANEFVTTGDIPTVGNGKITLTQGGTVKGFFTTNQSGDATIDLDAGSGEGYQLVSNLVTSVSSSSTDSQYPSAKLFYDTCGDIETLINAL